MKPELEKLARHRFARAREAFAEGDLLLTKDAFMGAVNRFYYADRNIRSFAGSSGSEKEITHSRLLGAYLLYDFNRSVLCGRHRIRRARGMSV